MASSGSKAGMTLIALIGLVGTLLSGVAAGPAPGQGSGQASLATYSGPDRMDRIVAGAKREGALTLYTTIAEKDLPILLKPFEAKYGAKVEVTTGITGEADIEITSGLNAKDEIVRGPSRVLKTLKDGMTVARQTKKPGNANGNEGS